MEHFEEQAARRLSEHASPMDTDRLWAQIDRELRPAKRRPVAIWWWATGTALLLAGAGMAWKLVWSSPAASAPSEIPLAQVKESPHAELPQPAASVSASVPASEFPTTLKELPKTATPTFIAYEQAPLTQGMNTLAPEISSPLASPTSYSIEEATPSGTRPYTPEQELSPLPAPECAISYQAPPLTHNTQCYRWKKRPEWYAGSYGGYGIPLKQLSSRKAEALPLLQARTATEKTKESWNVGAFIGRKWRNNWLMEAGAEWTRINERFHYVKTDTDTLGKTVITTYIIHAPGDTSFTQQEITLTRVTRTERTTWNKYNLIQIPLTAGYEWELKRKWLVALKGGVSLNVALLTKAEIMTDTANAVLYHRNHTGASPFRTQIGIIPHAEVGIRYAYNRKWSVIADFRYQHTVGSLTRNNYDLNQRYGLPGIRLGAAYRL